MQKKIEFNLPEFVFFDGQSHEGDSLENRDVIFHVRTGTAIEVLALDDIKNFELKKDVPTYEFSYKNNFGIVERHLFALHFSFQDYNFKEIFEKSAKWYCDYLSWEDKNIVTDYDVKRKAQLN